MQCLLHHRNAQHLPNYLLESYLFPSSKSKIKQQSEPEPKTMTQEWTQESNEEPKLEH